MFWMNVKHSLFSTLSGSLTENTSIHSGKKSLKSVNFKHLFDKSSFSNGMKSIKTNHPQGFLITVPNHSKPATFLVNIPDRENFDNSEAPGTLTLHLKQVESNGKSAAIDVIKQQFNKSQIVEQRDNQLFNQIVSSLLPLIEETSLNNNTLEIKISPYSDILKEDQAHSPIRDTIGQNRPAISDEGMSLSEEPLFQVELKLIPDFQSDNAQKPGPGIHTVHEENSHLQTPVIIEISRANSKIQSQIIENDEIKPEEPKSNPGIYRGIPNSLSNEDSIKTNLQKNEEEPFPGSQDLLVDDTNIINLPADSTLIQGANPNQQSEEERSVRDPELVTNISETNKKVVLSVNQKSENDLNELHHSNADNLTRTFILEVPELQEDNIEWNDNEPLSGNSYIIRISSENNDLNLISDIAPKDVATLFLSFTQLSETQNQQTTIEKSNTPLLDGLPNSSLADNNSILSRNILSGLDTHDRVDDPGMMIHNFSTETQEIQLNITDVQKNESMQIKVPGILMNKPEQFEMQEKIPIVHQVSDITDENTHLNSLNSQNQSGKPLFTSDISTPSNKNIVSDISDKTIFDNTDTETVNVSTAMSKQINKSELKIHTYYEQSQQSNQELPETHIPSDTRLNTSTNVKASDIPLSQLKTKNPDATGIKSATELNRQHENPVRISSQNEAFSINTATKEPAVVTNKSISNPFIHKTQGKGVEIKNIQVDYRNIEPQVHGNIKVQNSDTPSEINTHAIKTKMFNRSVDNHVFVNTAPDTNYIDRQSDSITAKHPVTSETKTGIQQPVENTQIYFNQSEAHPGADRGTGEPLNKNDQPPHQTDSVKVNIAMSTNDSSEQTSENSSRKIDKIQTGDTATNSKSNVYSEKHSSHQSVKPIMKETNSRTTFSLPNNQDNAEMNSPGSNKNKLADEPLITGQKQKNLHKTTEKIIPSLEKTVTKTLDESQKPSDPESKVNLKNEFSSRHKSAHLADGTNHEKVEPRNHVIRQGLKLVYEPGSFSQQVADKVSEHMKGKSVTGTQPQQHTVQVTQEPSQQVHQSYSTAFSDPGQSDDSGHRSLNHDTLIKDGSGNTTKTNGSEPFLHQLQKNSFEHIHTKPTAPQKPVQHFFKEVARELSLKFKQEKADIQIRVQNEAFGKVSIKLHIDGDVAKLMVMTESDESRQLLQKHAPELRENLAQHGIKVEKAEFISSGQRAEYQLAMNSGSQRGSQQQFSDRSGNPSFHRRTDILPDETENTEPINRRRTLREVQLDITI